MGKLVKLTARRMAGVNESSREVPYEVYVDPDRVVYVTVDGQTPNGCVSVRLDGAPDVLTVRGKLDEIIEQLKSVGPGD